MLLPLLFSLFCALPVGATPAAGISARPILQPHTYVSPSGDFELHVDPSRREGDGPATYRLSRSGVVLWERQHAVSMWAGGVTDEGRFAGFAYSEGPAGKGALHLLVANPGGELLLDEALPRHESRTMHSYPEPAVSEYCVSGERDRLFVRLGRGAVWRAYALSSGERKTDWPSDVPLEGAKEPWVRTLIAQTPAPDPAPLASLERIELVHLRPEVVEPPQAIRDVQAFVVREQGGIEFVRASRTSTEFVTLSGTGELLEERSLPHLRPASGRVRWYPGSADEWFATVLDHDADGAFTIHRVDVRRGTQRPIESFVSPQIDALVSTQDGGFALLGSTGRGTSRARLMAVSATDEVLWQLDEESASHKYHDQLFATENVTRTTGGSLAVLSTVRDSVQVFSADGKFVRYIDLEEAWGHDPRYPTEIFADERGGFCVLDESKLWRMTLEGELVETWTPASSLANPFSMGTITFEPDGTHWSTALDLFTSRNPDGSPAKMFGKRPPIGAIVRPRKGTIDRGGFIHILSYKQRTWYVFDAGGGPRAQLTVPEAWPVSRELHAQPTLGPGGHWFVPLSHRGDEQGHFEFSPSGEALRQIQLGANRARFCGPGTRVWSRAGFGTRLEMFENGVSRRLLERRPGRQWFTRVQHFAASADGTTLVVLDDHWQKADGPNHSLAVHDSNGGARFTLPLPEPFDIYQVATSDRWAVVTSFGHEALLVNLESKRIVQLELEESGHSFTWGFSPDGKELWAVDIQGLMLERYALPAEPSEPDRK